jgi:DNA-binding MarR family transcriptional regulator
MNRIREDSFLQVQNVGFALNKARNLVRAELDAALAGTGVSTAQAGPLLLLSQGLAGTSADLARLLGVDPGFITRVVDRLEAQGFLRRERDTPDRRVVNLKLTEAGRQVAARFAEIETVVLNRRLAVLTPEEFAALSGLLGKLLDT